MALHDDVHAGLGTEEGWHYIYPIHEVPDNKLTSYQGAPSTAHLSYQFCFTSLL